MSKPIQKPGCDIAALAAVLHRFLSKKEGAYGYSAGGYFSGKVQTLFAALIDDWDYYSVADRPHSHSELKTALRKHSGILHAAHQIIVTLKDGGLVMLGTAEKKASE